MPLFNCKKYMQEYVEPEPPKPVYPGIAQTITATVSGNYLTVTGSVSGQLYRQSIPSGSGNMDYDYYNANDQYGIKVRLILRDKSNNPCYLRIFVHPNTTNYVQTAAVFPERGETASVNISYPQNL